jgi:hypothetical protein
MIRRQLEARGGDGAAALARIKAKQTNAPTDVGNQTHEAQ